jgi:hypothetical protein
MNNQFWYTARVKNVAGIHFVFYATTRPRIGSACAGIAKPNKIIGFKRESYLKRALVHPNDIRQGSHDKDSMP